jgi:superfamily II DNA/RNA helicase
MNDEEHAMGVDDRGFAELGVDPFFVERLRERSIAEPMDIQRRVMPRLLAGERVLFSSPTGTGKTFAYLIPVIQKLMEGPAPGDGPEALILAPTFELCAQIRHEAEFLAAGQFRITLLIGTRAVGRQVYELRRNKPRIVVGNSSRIIQLARMNKLRLSPRFLILDEADRLTADDLYGRTRDLAARIRGSPQIAACSATLTGKRRDRIILLMGGSDSIAVEETGENEVLRCKIEHWAFLCERRKKLKLLRSFLAALRPRKTLIFTSNSDQVGDIVFKLQYHGIPALGLFGDMDRKLRKQAVEDFRQGRSTALVASDLAARGLDIPDVSHIISLDTGEDPEAYIHRCGRTARAGKRGIVASFGDELEMRRLLKLEKKLGIVVYPKELYEGKLRAPFIDGEEAGAGIGSAP